MPVGAAMLCNSPNVVMWNAVPTGSRLELKVIGHPDPRDDEFVANATYVPTVDPPELWPDVDIRQGPKHQTLTLPNAYEISVNVEFTQDDVAQVQAQIVTPKGTVHDTPFCHQINGRAGETHAVTITALL